MPTAGTKKLNISLTFVDGGSSLSVTLSRVDAATSQEEMSATVKHSGLSSAAASAMKSNLGSAHAASLAQAKNLKVPAPSVGANGLDLSWSGLTYDQADQVQDFILEQALPRVHQGLKSLSKQHPQHGKK